MIAWFWILISFVAGGLVGATALLIAVAWSATKSEFFHWIDKKG